MPTRSLDAQIRRQASAEREATGHEHAPSEVTGAHSPAMTRALMTPLRSWELFVFGAAALSLLFIGALAYRVVDASGKSETLARQSHEVLENVERLHRAAVSIESSSRAYVITGEVAYVRRGAPSLRACAATWPPCKR